MVLSSTQDQAMRSRTRHDATSASPTRNDESRKPSWAHGTTIASAPTSLLAQRSRTEDAMSLPARQHRTSEADFKPALIDDAAAHERQPISKRLLEVFYESRMRKAVREINRHRDAIDALQKRLSERQARPRLRVISPIAISTSRDAGNSSAPSRSHARGCESTATHSVRHMISEWRQRHRTRQELMTLNYYELRDLGMTPAEAQALARRPFWRE